MQKFIKNLVWVLTVAVLSPFILTGFIGATVLGCIMVGAEVAEVAFHNLMSWVQSDD